MTTTVRRVASVGLLLASAVSIWIVAAQQQARADAAIGETSTEFLTPLAGSGPRTPPRLTHIGPVSEGPLDNGAEVVLSDTLRARVFVSPFPPSNFDITVEIQLIDIDGNPVETATMSTEYDMAVMWHGPFYGTYEYAPEGRYRVDLDLFMFGPWELTTSFSVPGHPGLDDLTLSIYVWPE